MAKRGFIISQGDSLVRDSSLLKCKEGNRKGQVVGQSQTVITECGTSQKKVSVCKLGSLPGFRQCSCCLMKILFTLCLLISPSSISNNVKGQKNRKISLCPSFNEHFAFNWFLLSLCSLYFLCQGVLAALDFVYGGKSDIFWCIQQWKKTLTILSATGRGEDAP